MLTLSPATRIFVAVEPIDLRKSFNGLYAAVQSVLGEEVLGGHLYVFTNKRRNRVNAERFLPGGAAHSAGTLGEASLRRAKDALD